MCLMNRQSPDYVRSLNTQIELINYSNNMASYCLEEAINECIQSCEDLEYITERTATNLVDKIVQFFENIISNMRSFAKTITDTVNAKIRTAEMKKNLRQLHVKAEQLKASGKRTINIPDFDQIERVLTENIRKLRKVSTRIVKNQYKTTVAMDEDFKDFLRLYDEAEKAFNEVISANVDMDIDKVIRWTEAQISGRDDTLSIIDETIQDIEEMEREVKRMMEKREIYGADIITAKVGIIRRMMQRLGNFIHNVFGRRMAKMIAAVVFVCA